MADSWKPAPSPLRRLNTHQRAMSLGSLDGRIRQAAPVPARREREPEDFNVHVGENPPDDVYLGRRWFQENSTDPVDYELHPTGGWDPGGTGVNLYQSGAISSGSQWARWLPAYSGPIDPDAQIILHASIRGQEGSGTPATLNIGAQIVFDVPGGGSTYPYTDGAWTGLTVPNDVNNFYTREVAMTFPTFGHTVTQVLQRLAGGSSSDGSGPGLRALRMMTSPNETTGPRNVWIEDAWVIVRVPVEPSGRLKIWTGSAWTNATVRDGD